MLIPMIVATAEASRKNRPNPQIRTYTVWELIVAIFTL